MPSPAARRNRRAHAVTTTSVSVAVALAMTLSACGRSGDGGGSTPTNPASSGASGGSASASGSSTAAGDIGTLKGVCGPGDAKGATAPWRDGLRDPHRRHVSDPGSAAAPGLGVEFFQTADGFAKWCNAAGGILGRKIVVDKLDAKLFNVGQVFTQACQK